jgi:hypothetical protein
VWIKRSYLYPLILSRSQAYSLTNASFERSVLDRVSSRNSRLFCTSFAYADFTGALLSGSNLNLANFTRSNILESQLRSVESLDRAILPNGTVMHMYNLVLNGSARNYSVKHWTNNRPNSIEFFQTKIIASINGDAHTTETPLFRTQF